MPVRTWILSLMIFSLFADGCGSKGSSPDFTFIDDYLKTWDLFAQGANELVPKLNQDTPRFQQQLAEALLKGDKRAPSRLIFYGLVQVGGVSVYDPDLLRACEELFGSEIPMPPLEKGTHTYFAGDLYFWWERHHTKFQSFPLYEEWRQRDFAKNTVIPMYERTTKKR